MEEHREQARVQQALVSKKELGGGPGGRMGGGGQGGRGGPHTPGRGAPPQDEGWNTVPISKNRPIDTSRLSKITKVGEEANFSHCTHYVGAHNQNITLPETGPMSETS